MFLTATLSALSLTGCGLLADSGDSTELNEKRDDITVGLLMPETETVRFDKYDYPLFKEHFESLTHNEGKIVYSNAEGSSTRQRQQFQQLINDKVDAIVVAAVDAKAIAPDVKAAKDAGIPVIAYDRLAEGPIDAYVSHDNELVGEVQARVLLDKLGPATENDKVVMINGSPTDPNSALFKNGAMSELKGKVNIVKSYDTEKWLPQAAAEHMRKAIQEVGASEIDAVYSANDGMAGAVIEVMQEAGITELPPVTGQDADIAAVQRIIAGTQHMTVYKSFMLEARGAADIAVAKVRGRSIQFDALAQRSVDSSSQKDIPALLVPVVALTKDNIADTVIKDGVYTAKEICIESLEEACTEIGLT